MISQFDYAALSAVVYNNVRGQDNKLTLPTGWAELPIYPNGIVSSITGFTARAYSNYYWGRSPIEITDSSDRR